MLLDQDRLHSLLEEQDRAISATETIPTALLEARAKNKAESDAITRQIAMLLNIPEAADAFAKRAEAALNPPHLGDPSRWFLTVKPAGSPTLGKAERPDAGNSAQLGSDQPSRAVNDVFEPTTVKLSCGCSPERAAQCNQRGKWQAPEDKNPTENRQCHIFMHEADLIELVFEIIKARFASAANAENNPSKEAVVQFLYAFEAGRLTKREKDILEKAIVILREL